MIEDTTATPIEKARRTVPQWVLPLVLLLLSLVAFWIVPNQRPPTPVTLTFDRSKAPVTTPDAPFSENPTSAREGTR